MPELWKEATRETHESVQVPAAGRSACARRHPSLAQQKGGVVNVATVGEPPTLDPMVSTADLVGIITQHFFETLFTFDKNWKVTPLLAEGMPDISPDGKVYTIKLRQGVAFHDGSPMTSEDVVASLKRWFELASRGKQTATYVDTVEAVDPSTIRIILKTSYAPLLALLSFNNAAAVIMPAKKMENPLKEPVGTGPYRLKERRPDQFIQLVRFDGYKSRPGEPDGYGGARKQLLDEIRFVPVPDPNTRIEGAISGQYDYVDALPVEAFDRLKNQKTTKPVLMKPFGWPVFVMNSKEGLMASQDARTAVRMALSMEDMLAGGLRHPEFFALNASMYPKDYAGTRSPGPKAGYNVADPDEGENASQEGGLRRQAAADPHESSVRVPLQDGAGRLRVPQAGRLHGRHAGGRLGDAHPAPRRPGLWDIYITHSPFLPEPALIGLL